MYKILRTILFLFPAETAHYISMNFLKLLCSIGLFRRALARFFDAGAHNVHCFGLNFKNPVGLAAGFDKNAKYLREIGVLGFGFVEIGTVTPRPQKGNDKPRLFRLPKDKALINRMGFNNDGVDKVARRLKSFHQKIVKPQSSIGHRALAIENSPSTHKNQISGILIGGNIGKNKTTPNDVAWKDYEICFRALHSYVDFFIVNVSSPNTPGLRELQEKEALKRILTHLQSLNEEWPLRRPILLKIAPDLSQDQIDDVIDLVLDIKLDGIVAANTTIKRNSLSVSEDELKKIGPGGLSGKPLKERSTEVVRYLTGKLNGAMPVIASGGVFTTQDAIEKFKAGAGLIEVYTGFIYEGPFIVHKLCNGFEM